jgi:hypothetical protein
MPITYNQTGVTYDSTTYTYDGEIFSPSVFPVAGVFVAWDDGPYVASPNWTEVTTDVRRLSIHRGRSSDFEQFETGTAQIVFNNRERKYDPFYTSGSLYGKLLPRRQVRVTAQIGGVLYEVYRGYIAGWPVTWSEYGQDSTVTVQCFDGLGLMVNEQVPTDWVDYYISSLSPRHYWKNNDGSGSTIRVDKGSTPVNITKTGTANWFEVPPLAENLIGSGTYFTSTGSTASAGISTTQSGFTFGTWLTNYPLASGDSIQINFYYNRVRCYIVYSPGTNLVLVGASNLNGGTEYRLPGFPLNVPQHVVVVVTSAAVGNASAVIYVNAQAVTPVSTVAAATNTIADEYLRIEYGAAQETFMTTAALTAAQIQNIYDYSTARLTETTSARMDRILGTTSWPAALESFPASPAGTVSEIGSGNGVIPELQLVADSEGGEIYVSKTGVLTLTARRDVFNATRSANVQATITDSGVGLRYGSEVEIQYDADNLKNDITVNYSGDGEVVQTNPVTIAAYGAAATTVETQLNSPTSANDLATLELGVEGVLVPQISPIDVSSNTAAADWQTILGLELLDRVTFKRTPTVGNQFSRDALINAIDHQVEPGVWRTQLTLSMRYTSPLTLDDTVLGKLDYNYLG